LSKSKGAKGGTPTGQQQNHDTARQQEKIAREQGRHNTEENTAQYGMPHRLGRLGNNTTIFSKEIRSRDYGLRTLTAPFHFHHLKDELKFNNSQNDLKKISKRDT